MFKPGLVSISFRSLSYEEIIKIAVDAGLESIEWGSDVHAPYEDEARLHAVAKATADAGLQCCSYGTYFRLGITDICELPKYISAAKILGTDILRLWCGDKGYCEYESNEKEKLISTCRKAAEIAEKEGVTLCLECHNNTFTDCPEGAREIISAVNSEHFKMYWQPNQFRSLEENLRYIEEIAGYTTHIHVFNWLGDKRFPLVQAKETWHEYLRKFEGEHQLLLEFMPDDRPESLAIEAKALKEIISEVKL